MSTPIKGTFGDLLSFSDGELYFILETGALDRI